MAAYLTPLMARLFAATLLPVMLAAAVFGYILVELDRSNREQTFMAAAEALSRTVDAELRYRIGLAQALASDPTLVPPDFSGFQTRAQKLVQEYRGTLNVILSDVDAGMQVFNLRQAGAELRPVVDPQSLRQTARSLAPSVTKTLAGRAGFPQVGVRAPVVRDGTAKLVLTLLFPASEIGRLAQALRDETGFTVAIIDAYNVLVARTDGDYAGRPAGAAAAVEANRLVYGPGQDGRDYVRAVAISAETGWRIAVGVPLKEFQAPLHRNIALVAILGLAAALLSSCLAVLIGRRISLRARAEGARARDQLEAALAAAKRADAAKSRFFAAASHDLRQPFQAMRLFHMVASNPGDPDKREAALAALGAAMEAGEELLHALLDISILEAGTLTPQPSSFDLCDFLEEVAAEYRGVAAAKGLELRVRPGRGAIVSDRVLLKRVLRNLISNAVRYTAAGGILVASRRRGKQVLIQVWDSGRGIPADRQEEIFEDFLQLDNPGRDRTLGLGLGLSIVRRMVHLLGHELTLFSRVGRGSVFTVIVEAGSCGRGDANLG